MKPNTVLIFCNMHGGNCPLAGESPCAAALFVSVTHVDLSTENDEMRGPGVSTARLGSDRFTALSARSRGIRLFWQILSKFRIPTPFNNLWNAGHYIVEW